VDFARRTLGGFEFAAAGLPCLEWQDNIRNEPRREALAVRFLDVNDTLGH